MPVRQSVSGSGAEEYLGRWGQGMPQKSHHATDATQEIYCEVGKRPPLRGTRERDRELERDRDRHTAIEAERHRQRAGC